MKSTIISAVSILVFVLVSSAFTTTYYVNGSTGNDAWDGLAAVWDGTHGPKKTIQAGINASAGTDTVSVADGTYAGAGNKDLDFGGRAITLRSQTGADTCIIDCEDSGRGFYFHSGESAASVLNGFTITNGYVYAGGGICSMASSPTIISCIIKGNSATGSGGGINSDASPTFVDCIIADNVADRVGGGLILGGGGAPALNGCTISGNSSGMQGGGCYWFDSSPFLNNCIITGNVANNSWGGGGIYSRQSDTIITNCRIIGNYGNGLYFEQEEPTITNCVISENSGLRGGIHCTNSNPTITNCTITKNKVTDIIGGGIYCDNSSPTIKNCILWDNEKEEIYLYGSSSPAITYSDIQGGWPGTGNINADPKLLPLAGGTLRLKHGSPCIDAGTSAAPAPSADMEGRSRWDDPNTPNTGGGPDSFFDIGAHEFKGWYVNGNPLVGNDAYNGAYPTWQGGLNGPELTIQAGINDAADGDVVTVAPWTYTGTGNRRLRFADGLPAGQTRLITLTSSHGADATIIDCEGLLQGISFETNEDATAATHGFTITNGYAGDFGAGIRCQNASPTITHCIITGNTAGDDGGGIDCWNASPVISNCKIFGNTATKGYGGGIDCWDANSSPTISNCVIAGNIAAASRGGGISCNGGDPTISNCLIVNNSSGTNGGGIWLYQSDAAVTDCTFALNEADGNGGGIYCELGNPAIIDSILWDDTPEEIYVVLGNPVVTYCDVEGGHGQPWFGTGCIDKNPLFVSGPLHDYYLSQTSAGQVNDSPCVDIGSAPAIDLNLEKLTTRTTGGKDLGTVDIGYHSPYSLWIYNIIRSSSNITIYWKSTPSASYIVEWSDDISTWTEISVGSTNNWTDVGGGLASERYYRVKEE